MWAAGEGLLSGFGKRQDRAHPRIVVSLGLGVSRYLQCANKELVGSIGNGCSVCEFRRVDLSEQSSCQTSREVSSPIRLTSTAL